MELTQKEKKLKEEIFKLIIDSKATEGETIRVLAWLLNSFKKVIENGKPQVQ